MADMVRSQYARKALAQYTGLAIKVKMSGHADDEMMIQQLSGGEKTMVRARRADGL